MSDPPWPPVSNMSIPVVALRMDRHRGPGQAQGPVRYKPSTCKTLCGLFQQPPQGGSEIQGASCRGRKGKNESARIGEKAPGPIRTETGRRPAKGRPGAGVAATQFLRRNISREPGCRPACVKREWGLPVVPVPGSRTQTHSKERYSLLHHEGSNQRATPFSTLLPFSSLVLGPGPDSHEAEGVLFSYL